MSPYLKFTERHYPGLRATVEGALVYPCLLLDCLLQPTAISFDPVVVVRASLLGRSLAPRFDVISWLSDTLILLPGDPAGFAGAR